MTRLAKTAPKFTSPASTRMRILEMFPCKFGLEGCEAERARKDARLAKTAPKFIGLELRLVRHCPKETPLSGRRAEDTLSGVEVLPKSGQTPFKRGLPLRGPAARPLRWPRRPAHPARVPQPPECPRCWCKKPVALL